MPKIRAATVAEHRQLQQAALLDAARVLLAEGGREALSFGALAARTGLARSSVYEYFRSKSELVEALCTVDLPLWAAEIEAGMAACDAPAARIEAYVRGQVMLATDPVHRAVVAVAEYELDDAARARLRAAHGGLTAMVVRTLEDLGHGRPGVAASLLQGVVEAAVRQIERVRGDAGTTRAGAEAGAGAGAGAEVGDGSRVDAGAGTSAGTGVGARAGGEAVREIADAAVRFALDGLRSGDLTGRVPVRRVEEAAAPNGDGTS